MDYTAFNGMKKKKMYRRGACRMGKITKMLKADTIGDMGIGAMIVFIAMVLVAGIAASVLIQTANRLEIQAMTTGQQTTGEISTGLHVIEIGASKSGSGLRNMTITVVPRSGSKDIDLSKAYIEISDTSKKCVLTYNSAGFRSKASINGSIYQRSFFSGINGTRFGIIVLVDADGSCTSATPVINLGDKVCLTINATGCFGGNGIDPRDDVFGLVQPEEGLPGIFSFTAPSSISQRNIFDLY
jgi:flagellin FlaB